MSKLYPIASPMLNGNEKKYVLDCLDSNWISSNGAYIEKFEHGFARYCSTAYAAACTSGTTALHLALLAHGVKPDDEIIIPALTFVATANAVTYCGAKPVFVDAEPDTWNMNPECIERAITPRTKGIIAVHLYGHPADMDPIMEVAGKHGLFVVEDAAEALGAQYKGRKVGSIGHSAAFSLFGNKIITTGEGGMITTNDEKIAATVKLLRGQGIDPKRKYWFPVVGYNYRMTNIQAAIGCAQLERVDWHVERRIQLAEWYRTYLAGDRRLTLPVQKKWAKNVYWMFSVVLNDRTESDRDRVMELLKERGIETRPFFYPMHILPPYRHLQPESPFPVANRLYAQGMNIPSHGGYAEEDIRFVSSTLQKVLDEIE